MFISKKNSEKKPIKAGVFIVEAGKVLNFTTHKECNGYCWIFKGVENFEIGGKNFIVKEGEVIKIPKNIVCRSYLIGEKYFTSFFMVCSEQILINRFSKSFDSILYGLVGSFTTNIICPSNYFDITQGI